MYERRERKKKWTNRLPVKASWSYAVDSWKPKSEKYQMNKEVKGQFGRFKLTENIDLLNMFHMKSRETLLIRIKIDIQEIL